MKNKKIVIISALVILIAAVSMAFVFVPKTIKKTEINQNDYDISSVIEEEKESSETKTVSSTLVSSGSSKKNESRVESSGSVSFEKKTSSSSKQTSSAAAASSASQSKSNTFGKSSTTSSKLVISQASSNKTAAAATTTSNTTSTSNTNSNTNTTNTTTQTQETPYYDPEPVVIPEVINEEEFDKDGNLIIDTDILEGKKAIAFTFDDGPSIYTPELLDGLRARGAHATFFMVGSRVEQYPDLLPIMVDDGHQIGNHTYNHIRMTAASESVWRNEIQVTDDAIFNACGQYATAFRPPYGSYTQYQARTVDKTFTMWSVDTLDWKTRNKYSVKNEILSHSRDGSIVLLHDLYKTSVDAVLEAIDELKQEGYVFVTVDELLTRYGYPISNMAHFSQYSVTSTVVIDKHESDTDTNSEIQTDSEISTDTDTGTDTEIKTDTDTAGEDTNAETETDIDTGTDIPDSTDTELLTGTDE